VKPITEVRVASDAGTSPSQRREPRNTATGNAMTIRARANNAVSSRERRSGSRSALSAIPTRERRMVDSSPISVRRTAGSHGAPALIATTVTLM